MESVRVFKDIHVSLTHLSPEYVKKVYKAYGFAKRAHMGQLRRSGDPYISHPLAVAKILADLKLDHDTIIAGLLHDVVEDTKVTRADIIEEFGEDVGTIVDGVTKMARLHYDAVESYYAENYRKMFMAMAKDIRVIFVKLADRLHNMRTCQAMAQDSKRRIAKETLNVYAPIANRLGMHNMSLELYELGFSACYPLRYSILLERMYRVNSGQADVLAHLTAQIKNQAKAQGIRVLSLVSREKRLYGIYQKMRTKKMRFSEVMDVYALRICVETVRECYYLLGIVHGLYRPKERKFKDYIASPKKNGYQSLHTVLYGPYGLAIEIQIRTEEMHLVATKGVAAHWLYKSGASPLNQQKHQAWFKQLVQAEEMCGSDAEYLSIVKHQVVGAEVYVLTPKGQVLELKKGATVLDMAYHVHTDIGHHSVYAEVDRFKAPLNQVLHNGQTVLIHTDVNSFPKASWLDFVVTSKAKTAVKQYLKEKAVVTERSLGQQMLRKEVRDQGGVDELNPTVLNQLVVIKKLYEVNDLFEQIALETLCVREIASEYIELYKQKEGLLQAITVNCDGENELVATCCCPLPGDRIVIVTEGILTHVHRENCRNLRRVNRVMPARWADNIDQVFSCVLKVTASPGNNLAYTVSLLLDMKAHILRMVVDEGAGVVHQFFTIQVRSLEHLALIIQSLNQLKRVHLVKREQRCGLLSLARV